MTNKPDWLAVAAAGDLTEPELDDGLRLDVAAGNLLAALRRAVEMLERHDRPDLAEQLCESFVRALSGKTP